MSSKQNNNIRVMCRFRPMNEIEQSKNGTIIYKVLKKNGTLIEHPDKVHHPQPMTFYFDKIFDEKAAQVEIFEEAALPLIDNIFEGYNATIFAYGQTGSGKTHTMMGDMMSSEMHPRHGIIPRVVREIWNRIVHASSNYEFELKVSFLEIYNEQIYDLLSTDGYTSLNSKKRKKNKRKKLIIREYSDQVFVENLNEIYVRDQNELFDLIKSANKHRISAQTNMNSNSSRSHAVLTIILGQEDIRTGNSKKSKFCLVDLAGSEKVGKTQAKGIRLKEATSINKSLTTLGTCMNKLADNMSVNGKSNATLRHIPFRESVLTRLLSDSLGGNCKTTLMINTSPCSYNVEETISTLRFGERAKKIKTKARINQIKTPQQYRKELQTAQTEIMKLYRIIEECAEDITNAFKGTLTADNCKSYKNLLDLKKYTLNILKGNKNDNSTNAINSSLLANILPDLSHLQSLKKIKTIKQQQKKLFANNNNTNPQQLNPQLLLRRQYNNESQIMLTQQPNVRRQITTSTFASPPSTSTFASPPSKQTKKPQQIQQQPPQFDRNDRLRRARIGSFEELNVDEPVKLVRNKKKKLNPLSKKNKENFRNTNINSANNAFIPPDYHIGLFDISSRNIIGDMKHDDGLSIGQMGGNFIFNDESELESGIDSEMDLAETLGIMSPAADGTQSDTSNIESYNPYFNFDDMNNQVESMEYTDFQEEELPKNFFDFSIEQRLEFAKRKKIDPLLIEYRYQIQNEIDWFNWDSGDEDIESDSEINCKQRNELVRDIDNNKQKMLMLCRFIRTKTLEYESRIDVEMSKYQSLAAQYRAKNEENSKLMQQNTNLEKLYEKTENDKRELTKNLKLSNRELAEKKKELNKLQKKLNSKLNELNIERQNQIHLSNSKTSMLRRKVHEKYGHKYMKRIETEIIRNNKKDINIRFHELAKAFNQQSNKYCDLEEIIEKSKRQLSKYEQLIKQKDKEKNELREEIENEDIMRKELLSQHNLEIKKIQENIKKSKNKADMWKRRAFVYKNAVNSLMEEAEFNNLNDDESSEDDGPGDRAEVDDKNIETDDDRPSFDPRHSIRIDVETMAQNQPKQLNSFSPRSMQRMQDDDDKEVHPASWVKHRKSRQSVGCPDELLKSITIPKKKVVVNRGRDKYSKSNYNKRSKRTISPLRNDTFYMTPSQKTALTSVKMKIRGGGGREKNVNKTPIRTTEIDTSKKIYSKGSLNNRNSNINISITRRSNHTRQMSQPLNGSLPPPTNRHTGYSSDEYQTNDKSRLDVPVVGIDNLLRNRSIENNAIDQSPSPNFMGQYTPGNMSPRGNSFKKKRATSPLPPPQRTQKLYQPEILQDRTSRYADDDSSGEEFEEEMTNQTNPLLSSNKEQYTSPAGSFFSKIKHTANDDDEDDYKYNNTAHTHIKPQRQKQRQSMPEPTDTDDDDYNFLSDDNTPSYNNNNIVSPINTNNTFYQAGKIPMLTRTDSGSRSSRRNLLGSKKKGRISMPESSFD